MDVRGFFVFACVGAVILLGCSANNLPRSDKPFLSNDEASGATTPKPDPLRKAIQVAMAGARRAVNEKGVTEAAMGDICGVLARLAQEPNLKNAYAMSNLHGGGATSVVLASESDDGLTLRLSRLEPGRPTPVHDHGSWAVAYVVEGRDRYVHWRRLDDGAGHDHAALEVEYRRTLTSGDCVHWLDPPHDIHSQEAVGEPTWELVLFGKNHGKTPRQYFDPASGQVTRRLPQ